MLSEDHQRKNLTLISKKVKFQSVAIFYQVATCFKLTKIASIALNCIERCFTFINKSHDFLKLDFFSFAKIISSSKLHVDSELEILNAIDYWMSYDYKTRSKFAGYLLSKVRFHLLSDCAVNEALSESLSLSNIDGFSSILGDCLKNRKKLCQSKPGGSNSFRYCGQNNFDIAITGGYDNQQKKALSNFRKISGSNLNIYWELPPMKTKRRYHRSVCCRGAIYVFGGESSNNVPVIHVERYSLTTNKWEIVADMPDRRIGFSTCAFMKYVFIFGGENKRTLDSCFKFDSSSKSWTEVEKMNESKMFVGCAVYQGRVVVSGGCLYEGLNTTSSVEAFDPLANKWSRMPSMLESRYGHSSVSIRNKLFIIGGSRGFDTVLLCEVFDSESKRFVFLKQTPTSTTFNLENKVATFSIGRKLVTIGSLSSTALYYDEEKNKWYEKAIQVTDTMYLFSCTLIPKLY